MLEGQFNAANTILRADTVIDILHRAARRRNQRDLAPLYSGLADELTFCPMQRCGLAACLVCLRAFQQAKASAHEALLVQLVNLYRQTLLYQAIIPRDTFYPCSSLCEFDNTEFSRQLLEGLQMSGVRQPFVGGIDFSLEESTIFGKYWQPHLHVSLFATDPVALREQLLEAFPRHVKYDYPVDVKEAYDFGFIPYAHKGMQINHLLRTGRTQLPELLLALARMRLQDAQADPQADGDENDASRFMWAIMTPPTRPAMPLGLPNIRIRRARAQSIDFLFSLKHREDM